MLKAIQIVQQVNKQVTGLALGLVNTQEIPDSQVACCRNADINP